MIAAGAQGGTTGNNRCGRPQGEGLGQCREGGGGSILADFCGRPLWLTPCKKVLPSEMINDTDSYSIRFIGNGICCRE